MYTSDLTREVLADLRAPRTYPAITLAMPTDPHAPFGDGERILLGDLLTQARRRLADDPDVARDTRLELRDRKLVREVVEDAGGPFHPGDALVVYVAAGEPVQVWQLTSPPVAPRVEFGTSFLTRYQVAAEQRAQPYLVLVLDQETCRLHLGSAGALTEVRGHGFPDAPQIPSPEDSLPGPIPHAAPYEDHGERIRQYLKTVDARLDEVLRDHTGRPVFVIGSAKMLSAFTDLTRHGDVIAGTLPLTGMDTRPPADLADRLEPLLVGFRARQVAGAVADLDAARARGTYAGGAPEVWTAVADKRVRRLVVEDDLVVAGRVGADGRDLDVVPFPQPVTLPAPERDQGPSPRAAGVATDIVEQLVENAILADSRVQFVPEGTLPDCGAGAVLRY